MYPVDVVKTRMQALACNTPKFQSKSVVRNILFMMREEGFWRPVQGVQAMALGAGPAHAMYFLSYETMKERLAPRFKQVILFSVHLEYHQWCIFPSGVHLNSHCTFWPAVVPPSSMTLWWLLLRWMNILLDKFLLCTADSGQSLSTMQHNALSGDQAADADVLLATQECNLCLQGELDWEGKSCWKISQN